MPTLQFPRASTDDGLVLCGILSTPSKRTDCCIVHTHGMSGNLTFNSFYEAMHKGFPEAGYAFLAGENRGSGGITAFATPQGGTRLIGNTFERFEDSRRDIAAWIRCAKTLGFTRIILQGHSLGCSKVAYYLAGADREGIAATLFLSPADMLGLVEEPSVRPLHERLLQQASTRADEELLPELLWDYALLSAGTYRNFFSPHSKTAIFNFFNPSYGFETLHRISCPVFAVTGTMDDGITPACDPFRAMKILEESLIGSPRTTTHVIPDASHDFEGFGDLLVARALAFLKDVELGRGRLS